MDRSEIAILIVDHEEQFRSAMSFDLKSRGYKVVLAQTMLKAVEFFPNMPFQAIVANLEEPTAGLTLLRYVRNLGKTTPFFLTFNDRELDPATLVAKGATGAFRKPFAPEYLAEKLQKALLLPDKFSYYLNVRRSLSIVSWVGEMRTTDEDKVKRCLTDALVPRPRFVILNLHDFLGFDPALAGEILLFEKKVSEMQAWLVVCGLAPSLQEKMAGLGLIKDAQILANLKEALQFVLDIGMK